MKKGIQSLDSNGQVIDFLAKSLFKKLSFCLHMNDPAYAFDKRVSIRFLDIPLSLNQFRPLRRHLLSEFHWLLVIAIWWLNFLF